MIAEYGRWQPIEILLVEDNPGDVELTREALDTAKSQTGFMSLMTAPTPWIFSSAEGDSQTHPGPISYFLI